MNETLDRLLSAYLDGTLSPARRKAVEKRLGEPRVSKRLAQLKALDEAVRASVAQPTDVQSRRMWLAIKGQIQAAAPEPEPWYAFLQKRWFSPALGFGLAGAAAVALGFVFLRPQGAALTPAVMEAEPAMEAAKSSAPVADAAPAAAPSMKKAEASDRAEAPTAVERALAEDPVDGLIERFLNEQPQPAAMALAPARRSRAASPMGGATMAAYGAAPSAAMAEESFDSAAMNAAEGGVDRNGFWDWRAAGTALNQRDWRQARIELEAAQAQAREAAERAFAASALTLLSAAGQPLAGTQPVLPSTGDLRVLGAGVWQLQMDSRLARFSRGFVARLPGFRVEGDTLLLDMTFDRGSFSAGSRFTRVSGEAAAKVFDAQAQPVAAPEFTAPSGAIYHVNERELHLR